MVGPTFRGLYGKQEEVVTKTGLQMVTMDDERLRLAIREPSREVVRGYPEQMPIIPIGDDELDRVVTYIKQLK